MNLQNLVHGVQVAIEDALNLSIHGFPKDFQFVLHVDALAVGVEADCFPNYYISLVFLDSKYTRI